MKVAVFPRDRNPYQDQLYRAAAARGVQVRYVGELTRSQTLNILLLPLECAVLRVLGFRVLHLHWVFRFALPISRRLPETRHLAYWWFAAWLATLSVLRMRLVWTAHNVLPHDQVFPDDTKARRRLLRHCAAVIAHSTATMQALAEIGPLPAAREVLAHPPYDIGPSPHAGRSVPRSDGEHSQRWLSFGAVESYKGVEDLVTAVASSDQPVTLTVLGECRDTDLANRLRSLAGPATDRVSMTLRRVAEDELIAAIIDSDVLVFPFRRVTTSGSLAFGMSCGRPAVVPDLPAFRHFPPDTVIRYDVSEGNPVGIADALREVSSTSPSFLRDRGERCRRHVSTTSWDDLARLLRDLITSPAASGGVSSLRSSVG